MSELGTYEGFDVSGATVSIRNAGDGLSQALEVEAVKLDLHGTVHVVLECEVTKHTYEEVKDDPDAVVLVNVLKAGRATLIEREVVAAALDEQTRKIEVAKAEAKEAEERARGQLQFVDPADGVEVDEGDPALAGDVGVEVLQEAERTAEWRRSRTAELDAKTKDDLVELATELGVSTTGRPTKSELVDAILDEEESRPWNG